jgi:membrane-bound ClpP family serine protease
VFLKQERPLALLVQLVGVALIAYELLGPDLHAAGGAALAGVVAFVIGTLLSSKRL